MLTTVLRASECYIAAAFLIGISVKAAAGVRYSSTRHADWLKAELLVSAPTVPVLARYVGSIGSDSTPDAQSAQYVSAVPLLALLAAFFAVVTCAVRRRGSVDLLALTYAVLGSGFIAVVHGPAFIMTLLTLSASYLVFGRLRRVMPRGPYLLVLWVVQVAYLYYVQEAEGFENYYWAQRWLPTSSGKSKDITGVSREPMWRRQMTWHSALRLSTLRMIAYHYDELEAGTADSAAAATARAVRKHDTSCVECALLREAHGARGDDSVRCYKYRTERPRDASEYGYVRYMAYMLFPPLYIGGPISSYNAFASHLLTASRAMPVRSMAVYALRIAFVYALQFFILQYLFIYALCSHVRLLLSLGAFKVAYVMYFALALLWMKFTFIWRTSRLFALWCGVDVPENMRRCFANSVTVRDFWRDWHASFNLWIVRYMYIPMGGRSHQLLAVVPIFFFVALWHDHTLSMLKWALCIIAFFVVESLVSGAFQRASCAVSAALAELDAHDGECARRGVAARVARCVRGRFSPPARRYLHHVICCVGGAFSLLFLIVANLIGFCFMRVGGSEKVTDSRADRTIAALWYTADRWFVLTLFAALLCACVVSARTREGDRLRQERESMRLCLTDGRQAK